jgi:conjugative relaxase-like TrwC/TraI family protein
LWYVLTAKAQYKLRNAEQYFKEHLSAGDYYTEGNHVPGRWFGAGAKELGLSGAVGLDDFVKLCRNINPNSDERMTQRMKTTGRRVFYDFTLSPPKSVSILGLVCGDHRIEESHQRATGVAVEELQRFASARVRKNGASGYRATGNVVGAIFHHDSSRALDPHLHCHCIVFNATRDHVEGQWKALETYEMLAACKYVENVYYHELAKDLKRCGYELENRRRGDFEVVGVPQEMIERFSKRHCEIDEKTRQLLKSSPEKKNQNVKDIREHIAHNERARKIKDIGRKRLESVWDAQVSAREKAQLSTLPRPAHKRIPNSTAGIAAIAWAEEHLFDRRSVVNELDLWRHALERGRGENFSLKSLHSLTNVRPYVRDEKRPHKVSTQKTLEREREIVQFAQNGANHHEPLNAKYRIQNGQLDMEQRRAVEQILGSRDFITLFRGAAGTGKSFTLKEVRAGLLASNHSVLVLAPQRQQVIDLQKEFGGFGHTVSEFLTKQQMSAGSVVIVDEAGQIGAKQMLQLLKFVSRNNGRLILSGDTRQHGPVEASDALRAIEKFSGLNAAELVAIRRQNPQLAKSKEERTAIEQYRLAVDDARSGRLKESFDRLNRNGGITQCGLFEHSQFLTKRYLELATQKCSTVVVSQTWAELDRVNEAVRQGLKKQNLVRAKDVLVTSLKRLDLTDAQKRDKRFYSESSVVVLNRDVARLKRGDQCRFLGIGEDCLVLETDGKIRPLSFKHLDSISVCEPKELALASGDRLQLKANAKTKSGRQIANGEIVTVKSVGTDGRIGLEDGRILESNYRQFVRGYAVTSYAAQGKTADYVLFADSAIKAATNQKQWYVTISRGRKAIEIFTTDKRELRENVIRSGDRELALELTEKTSVKELEAHHARQIRQRGIRA